MPFFESSDGVRLHYTDSGTGLPLLMVHGWSMSGVVWRFQAPLSGEFRLITFDLCGHGRSEGQDRSCRSMVDFARDLVELIDYLQLERVAIAGWSMGGQVALEAAGLLGQRLAALILIGTTPRFTANGEFPHGQPADEARGMGLRLKRDFMRTMGDFFKRMFADGELDHDAHQRLVHEIVMAGRLPEPRFARECLNVLASADQRYMLPLIKAQVLLIHGDQDTICLPDASRYMADILADARLVILEGVGHAPFLSRPDHFNKLLADFLEGKND